MIESVLEENRGAKDIRMGENSMEEDNMIQNESQKHNYEEKHISEEQADNNKN